MIFLSASLLGVVVASSAAPERAVVQRLPHRGYDELIEQLAGSEISMRGWLSPTQVAWLMCNQFEETKAALSELADAGDFLRPSSAILALHLFSSEWSAMFTSMPMTAVIAWARGNVDMSVASRMTDIMRDYTSRYNDICGFKHLPWNLQRHSHRLLGQSNPPDFRIITDGLTEGQLAHFPDSVAGDVFTPITTTFGQVTRGSRSWYYDIERKCTVVCLNDAVRLIPELPAAISLQGMKILTADSRITIWYPHQTVRLCVGTILGITDPLPIVSITIDKLRMQDDDDHFFFHVTVNEQDRVVSKLIIFDVNDARNFDAHPINALNAEFRLDGGFALTNPRLAVPEPRYAVPLFPDALFEGDYPKPQPRRIEQFGQFLIDGNLALVIESFQEWMTFVLEEPDDYENFREKDEFSDEQKKLLEVCECVNSDPRSEKCKEAIAAVLTGKPDSSLGIEMMIDDAFNLESMYEVKDLEEILH